MAAILFLIQIPREDEDDDNTSSSSTAGEGSPAKQGGSPKRSATTVSNSKETLETDSSCIPAADAGTSGSESINQAETVPIDQEKPQEEDTDAHSKPTDTEERGEGDGHDKSHITFTTVTERYTLEEVLQSLLQEVEIDQDVWTSSHDKCFWQVTFIVNDSSRCDAVLNRLTSCGFGSIPDTSISLYSAYYHKGGSKDILPRKTMESEETEDTDESQPDAETALNRVEDSASDDFVKSIKSRLTVAQVVQGVQQGAKLTFDFLAFVILASIIAGLGLAENSSVVLVASMLVSPIMGPILGGTFGLVIQHQQLRNFGVKNELISLSICVICGFFMGLIMSAVNSEGAAWGSTDSWPTAEMQSRGLLRSLWVGVLIALPSGAGVALSILGGNAGSLVGVAISASLLPPAVNAGILWAYSVVTAIHPPPLNDTLYDLTNSYDLVNMTVTDNITIVPDTETTCSSLQNNNYQFVYSCNMSTEAFLLGLNSFFLTLLNIVCIFITGVAVLKIKEVAPSSAISDDQEVQFWKQDIQVAREAYRTIKRTGDDYFKKAAKDMVCGFARTLTYCSIVQRIKVQ